MLQIRISRRISIAALVLLWTAVLCVGLTFSSKTEAAQPRTVRIPYGFNDFLIVDNDGNVSGYYAEYFENMASVNNWQYEYVKTTWPGALEMLESGEIDLLYPVNYIDERTESMDYSDMSVGYIASGIFSLKSSDYTYMDYSAMDGAKIACDAGTSNISELDNLARNKGFSYEIIYKNTNYELIDALKSGEADFAIFNSAASFPDGYLIAIMEAKPVYITVRKGNTELMSEINYAMEHLLKNNPELVANTMKKTIAGDSNGIEAFAKEEKEFIDSNGEIVVGFYKDSEPLAYVNSNGSYDGIYVEFINEIEKETGLNITLVPLDRNTNWKDKLRNGEIDFYIGASKVIVSADEDIFTTDSFMEYTNCLITRNDCNFSRIEKPVIALTYGRKNWADYLSKNIDNEIEFAYYATAKECMLAVVNKKVDAAVINNIEFNYQSKNERLSSLIRVTTYAFPTDISFATTDRVDNIEISVLNKAMKAVSTEQIDDMVNDYLNISYHSYSFWDYVYNSRYVLLVTSFILLMIGIVLSLKRSFNKKRENIEREAQQENLRNLNILSVMSREYECIYFVNLDKGNYKCIYNKDECEFTKIQRDGFFDKLREYVQTDIPPVHREQILPMCDKQECIERVREEKAISIRYVVQYDGLEKQIYEMHFIMLDNEQQKNQIVFGIRCIDSIVKKERERQLLLTDALDNANSANLAKSDFLSRMSHDIRTPMNAIIGLTVITAAHANEPERVRENLDKISSASRYLLSLINEVLDMSKIEAGKMTLSEENVDLPEFVNGILEIIRPKIKEHGHELRVDVQNVKHEKVITDTLRLQQVFINIMDNAVKYTPDGGNISLEIREIPTEIPMMCCYRFVFKDNGVGMSEEFQKHLFEPFKRENDLRISKIQGTGLGMSITRNIVQMMSGTIEVDSSPGEGTEFKVTLFFKLQETKDVDVSEFKNLSVLVADDDEDACEALCTILDEIGIKGKGCTSGQAAVEAVRSSMSEHSNFYAAILDWRMPEMDGVETARAIRQLTKANMPIIILSAYDWSDIEDEARAAGVDLFLSKPVFKSGIIRLFRSLKNKENGVAESLIGLRDNRNASYAGHRALLVEDNFLNREIAKEILDMEGIISDEAENGRLALDMFSSSEEGYYDIILMDIRMPVMDGYAATEAIRALKRSDAKSVPIIAMTADAFMEDIQKSKAAGMDEHIAKPIDVEKLNKIFAKYLRSSD